MDPEPFASIRADVRDKIMPGLTHWSSPRFLAFFPCARSYPADIADMYSNAFSGAHFNWVCGPACTELEAIVMDWLAQALGLPECYTFGGSTKGGGVIHNGASEALLLVMVGAREKYLAARTAHLPDGPAKEDEVWRLKSRLVVLGSTGAHSSTRKAAQILGLRCVSIPVFEQHGFALQAADLAETLDDLAARGLEPFYLTLTMGTTDLCAVDDFAGIAALLQPRAARGLPEIHVHVDAAHAGSALILPEYQHYAKPLASFHSFNFNPHKWLLVTFDCSATFVKSRRDLTSTLSINPPYLRNQFSDGDVVTDYRDWQITLGRRFRSLKLWFVLRSYGISGLRRHIRNGIALCEVLEAKIRGRPDLFTVFTPASFALLSLRIVGAGEQEVNTRTQQVFERVNAAGEFYLTATVVDEKFAIRVCTAVADVREEHVQRVFEVLVEEAERLHLFSFPGPACPRL